MKRTLIGSLALGAVLAVFACGGDGDGASGPEPGTSSSSSGGDAGNASAEGGDAGDPIGTAATAMDTALCNRQSRCSPDSIIEDYADVAGCVAHHDGAFAEARLAPGFAVTVDQLDACTARLASAACQARSPLAECFFMGTLPTGSPCRLDLQCAGKTCARKAADACGKCAELGAVGAACGDGKPACQASLTCAILTGKCAQRGALGEECVGDSDACADGLLCHFTSSGPGTCVTPLESGASCSDAKTECDYGLVCEDGACKPLAEPPIPVGHACSAGGNGQCSASTCPFGTQVCTPFRKTGESCDSSKPFVVCEPGATCRGSLCVHDDPAGCK